MLAKRIIIVLTFSEGVLYRTKNFNPDYRYTDNFIDNKLVDEIVLIDVSRNLGHRNKFYEAIKKISKSCFVPITVGGLIRNIEEIKKLQSCGADKILINSLIHINENEVKKITEKYGSQFVIAGIDFLLENNNYSIYIKNGKKKINLSINKCLKKIESCKVGEILVQSIDRDGSLRGYDNKINNEIKKKTNLPVLVCGGAGNWSHFEKAFRDSNVDGVCTNNIYHDSEKSVNLIKKSLYQKGIHVRRE
jgi:cyclase